MRLRIFSAGPFPVDRGTLDLDALPRPGDTLLTRDPYGAIYYEVRKILHVEGSLPIAFVVDTNGEGFEGLDLAETGLASRGSLRPLSGYNPFADCEYDLDVPQLGLGEAP